MAGNMMLWLLCLITIIGVECTVDEYDTCMDECRVTCENPYVRSGVECTLLNSGVNGVEATTITDLHNKYRSEVASGKHAAEPLSGQDEFNLPSSSDMMQMEWDENLQKSAQAQANLCMMDGECPGCRLKSEHGQNVKRYEIHEAQHIDGNGNMESYMLKSNWFLVIWSWFDQMQNFDWKKVKNFSPDGKTDDFTQMIWAETMKVGCGYSAYKQNGSYYQLYICNYAPLGNVEGEPVYAPGFPCYYCPEATCCGGKSCHTEPNYEGLCKIRRRKAPRDPANESLRSAVDLTGEEDDSRNAAFSQMDSSSLNFEEELP